MVLTLKQLYSFRAVAEFGSFTRAADRLNTAQPILSTQIRDLEIELGIKLFDRTTRRVELTVAGREFLAEVADIVERLERAVSRTNNLALRQRGHLAVAAPPLLSSVWMPIVFAAFTKENPGIKLSLIDKPTVEIIDAVRNRTADLGIGTFPAHVTDISRMILAKDELLLLRAGTGRSGKDMKWSDLAHEDLITLSTGSGIRALVDQALRAADVVVKPAFEVDHVATALALAAAGLGVTALPSYAANHANLCAHRLREPDIRRDIAVITPLDCSPSPAATKFIALLRRHSKAFARGKS